MRSEAHYKISITSALKENFQKYAYCMEEALYISLSEFSKNGAVAVQ